MPVSKTKAQILDIACAILATEGLGAVSFDSIARQLGKSKQAVLYWFPTKQDLLAAMYLPWLDAEAEVAAASVAQSAGTDDAISDFVRGVAKFHLDDLNRFRLMYLLPQTLKPNSETQKDMGLVERVHPITDKIYSALAVHLQGDAVTARRQAVAIHSSVLGLVMMFGLADRLQDPLKHSEDDLIDALVSRLSGTSSPQSE